MLDGVGAAGPELAAEADPEHRFVCGNRALDEAKFVPKIEISFLLIVGRLQFRKKKQSQSLSDVMQGQCFR